MFIQLVLRIRYLLNKLEISEGIISQIELDATMPPWVAYSIGHGKCRPTMCVPINITNYRHLRIFARLMSRTVLKKNKYNKFGGRQKVSWRRRRERWLGNISFFFTALFVDYIIAVQKFWLDLRWRFLSWLKGLFLYSYAKKRVHWNTLYVYLYAGPYTKKNLRFSIKPFSLNSH